MCQAAEMSKPVRAAGRLCADPAPLRADLAPVEGRIIYQIPLGVLRARRSVRRTLISGQAGAQKCTASSGSQLGRDAPCSAWCRFQGSDYCQ